jgi:phospholipid/cholesterol/gamma-HCH transport system permease protein
MDAAQAPTQRWQQQGAGWTLALAGDWRGAAASGLQAAPAALGALASGTLKVDAQALAEWDAGLAAALRDRLAPLARQGVTLQLEALPDDVRAVLELALPVPGSAAAAVLAEPPPSGLAALGQWVIERSLEAASTLAFFGEVLLALGRLLRGRSGLRGGELLRQIDQTGPLSIGIVALTCFLVGLMLAYMGGAQLDKLGAQAYIADLVTVGMVREVAGLMTGMILAGRVGSAFAAQLATMKAGEEIDALRALGVDIIDHLVMPRILALVMVAPLVMAYAALVGVLAGLIPATMVYGVPASEYLHKSLAALTWTHLWIGLFKCTLYAVLLALAGCREGLHAGRNAQALGEATTRAVVKGLVWIISAACITTVVLQSLGY